MGDKKKKSKKKSKKNSTSTGTTTKRRTITQNDNEEEYNNDGNIIDERFQIAQSHPQFQKLHTKKKKGKSRDGDNGDSDDDIQDYHDGDDNNDANNGNSKEKEEEIDDRFKALLTDSRFALGGDIGVKEGGVDKYGRKQKKKKKKTKSDDGKDDDDADDDNDNGVKQTENGEDGNDSDDDDDNNDNDESSSSSEREEDDDDGEKEAFDNDPESRIAYLTALSRGEIDFSSTDDESSSDDDEENEQNQNSSDDDSSTGLEDSIYGKAGILDPSSSNVGIDGVKEEIEITFDKSRFLAVCNMDWTNVKAVDLLAVLSSFAPPGSVKFVHIYPSDFGLEKMEKDKMFGPVGVWKKKKKTKDSDKEENAFVEEIEESGDDEEEQESKNDSGDESSKQSQKNNAEAQEDSDDANSGDDDDDNEEEDDIDLNEHYDHFKKSDNNKVESDFDAEKLRAYEAAKLKYYFAVVEFTSTDAADVAYKELDGMEMGHSSASIDLRSIPEPEVEDVIKGRQFRDKASVLPSNYVPPDFVVAALQQTDVKCSWEDGDKERERMLTQYGVGNDAWSAMAEGDDLRAYLASGRWIRSSSNYFVNNTSGLNFVSFLFSDASDDDDDDDGSSVDEETNQNNKGSNMRKLLGLDDDDNDEDLMLQIAGKDDNKDDDDDDDSFFGGGNDMASNDSDEDEEGTKSFTYIPGKQNLEEKIRSKINEKKDENKNELTPWEKYQLKRKEKRKEKKRQAKEAKLVLQGKISESSTKGIRKNDSITSKAPSSKEELDLLLAGDNGKLYSVLLFFRTSVIY